MYTFWGHKLPERNFKNPRKFRPIQQYETKKSFNSSLNTLLKTTKFPKNNAIYQQQQNQKTKKNKKNKKKKM